VYRNAFDVLRCGDRHGLHDNFAVCDSVAQRALIVLLLQSDGERDGRLVISLPRSPLSRRHLILIPQALHILHFSTSTTHRKGKASQTFDYVSSRACGSTLLFKFELLHVH